MYARYFIFFLITCFITISVIAQSNEVGIFLTAEDFTSKKITHASAHTHIKLHEVFKKSIVEVKLKDSTYTYAKKNIFGYSDKEGNMFRFFNDGIYPILNPTELILIYVVPGAPPMKGQARSYSYYFSKDAGKEILPLSMNYFEDAFKDNTAYQKMLEIHFSDNSDLLEYDHIHNMYKVNRLLELAKK